MLQLQFKDASRKTLWLVEQSYTIGSSAQCTLTIADVRLKPHHADLLLDGDVGQIRNLHGDNQIRVNGIPVSDSHPIAHGDRLILGMTELAVIDPKRHTMETEAAERAAKAEGHWVLKPMSRALGERQYVVNETAVIGRARECDISLGVAHLSRRHARLTVTERGLRVDDLDSANGTFVNGQRIKTAVLKPGDQLSFDAIQFQINGPQVDLDVTTVRPVISIQQAKSQPVSGPQRPARAAARDISRPGQMGHQEIAAATARSLTATHRSAGNAGRWMIILASLGLCAVVGLLVAKYFGVFG